MFSIKIPWTFRFLNCFIFLLTVSGVDRPGVRTLLTTRGLNFVRKLAIPVLLKKLNNLEIPPVSGNVDLFVGNLNYKFKNIKLSEIKIPKSYISMLNGTGISVQGTEIAIKLDELWSYDFASWPFISDKGSSTVSAKELALNIIIGVSKGSKEEPSVIAKDCSLNIGKLDIKFYGGASFLYNLFMTFIKEQLKNQVEEVICHNAVKAVNKEINETLRTIPGEVLMANDTLKRDLDLVRAPQFLPNGVEIHSKAEFLRIKHPKMLLYTPEELPPIRNEHSKMMYMWITAYTINTLFFAVNQSGPQQYMFDSDDLPDSVPIKLNTNAFVFSVPPLYWKYPGKNLEILYRTSAPAKITLNPNDGLITLYAKMTFFVILDNNTLVDCFTLNVVEVAHVNEVLVFRKGNYSYIGLIGLKISNSRTDITLQETHIGNFDLTLLQFTFKVLAQYILSIYISPKMEEGFKLPLPKDFVVKNSETAIGKNYILVFTDLEKIHH